MPLQHVRLRAVAVGSILAVGMLAALPAPGWAVAASSPVGGPDLSHHGVVSHGQPPQVYAKSWLVADATTGEVLAAKNAHLPMRPASTLKTLTAVTLLPRMAKQQVYRARYEDAAVEGSAVGIVPGGTYTVNQLFYGLLLPSGNDAAHALASAAGGMHRTVRLMRAEAEKLQAGDTTVRNPSGLDAPGQYSSAYDLALFAREGLQRRDFRHYVATTSFAFPGRMPHHGKKRDSFMIYNQNLLLDDYRGALGVKTGYTTLAGRTFVGAAERHGHTLIVALMGIIEPSESAAARLLTWGFANTGQISPVGHLVDPLPAAGSAVVAATNHDPVLAAPSPLAQPTSSNGPNSWRAIGAVAVVAGLVLLVVVVSSRRSRAAGRACEQVPFAFRK